MGQDMSHSATIQKTTVSLCMDDGYDESDSDDEL